VVAPTQKLTIRYYLWTEAGPFRLPDRLHRDLINHRVKLRQFAGSMQKLVELVIRSGEIQSATARGVVYAFDKDGYLDLRGVAQHATPSTPRFADNDAVKDLSPTISKRRFQAEYTWRPGKTVLDRIRSDMHDAGAIPVFRITKKL